MFKIAREQKPSIIFIDELDAIAKARSDDENDSIRRVKTELLVQIGGIEKNEGVFLMATTNTPHQLDSAILRRFTKRIYIPPPNPSDRYKMLQKHFSDQKFSNEVLTKMAEKTKKLVLCFIM